MKKNNLIVLILIAVIIVLVLLFVTKVNFNSQETETSPYSVVYLETGDIYFGKLKHFPQLEMTQVWLIQRVVGEENSSNLSVVPFSSAFWGPIDKIRLNPDKVVFSTRLRKDSQVVKIIENPNLLNQAPAPSQ